MERSPQTRRSRHIDRRRHGPHLAIPATPNGLLLKGARALVLLLVTICVYLLARNVSLVALAASGNDPMTITLDAPIEHSRHQLDGIEAYCCDSWLQSPPVGTVLTTWHSGSLALDYVLYHSDGCPEAQISWVHAKRVVWALVDPECEGKGPDDPAVYAELNAAGEYDKTRPVYDAAVAFAAAGGRGPERGTSRIYDQPDSETQRVCVGLTGRIELEKVSTSPADTNGKDAYSLEGAVYGIYRDPACTDEVEGARMTTDSQGHATSRPLGAAAPTTYYVKEIQASAGFDLSDEILEAEVSANATVQVTSHETPRMGRIELEKVSTSPDETNNDDTYSLEGAVYGIYRDRDCTDEVEGARMTTDSQGRATSRPLDAVSSTKYYVKELQASAGFELSDEVLEAEVGAHVTVRVVSHETPRRGWLDIVKTSADSGISRGNACYDLGGARYGIYTNESCTPESLVQTLTLAQSADGLTSTAKSDTLKSGTYWVRELGDGAPRGYLADTNIYPVTVVSDATARVNAGSGGIVADVPAIAQLSALVAKADAELAEGPQGSATLEGALFEVRYFAADLDTVSNLPSEATRTWVFRSNAQGEVHLDDPQAKVSGADLYTRAGSNEPILPLGTYAIREISAPAGYWLEGQNQDSGPSYVAPTHISRVVSDSSSPTGATVIDVDWASGQAIGHESFGSRVVANNVRRAGISIDKHDRETGRAEAQAGASLMGISFGIFNLNDHPVCCGGQTYAPGEEVTCLRLVTNAQGHAQTSPDALPLGTYELRELTANGSYLEGCDPQRITLTAADTQKITSLGQPFDNAIARGGVRVGKVDLQNAAHAPQGAGSFAGVVMGVRLCERDSAGAPQHAAVIDGTLVQPGALATTITLDHEGFGQTEAQALPYGSYELCELSVPSDAGYFINNEWRRSFDVHEDGVVVDLSSEADSVPDEVKRGDFRAIKAEESTQARLGRIPFVIESLSTGEWHVIVSDMNGQLDSSSGWASRENGRANANDAAVTQDEQGGFALSAPELLDDEAGVWFSGRTDLPLAPDDAPGALPYDSYRLLELRVSDEEAALTQGASNAGSELASLTLHVYRHKATIDLGTIDNQPAPAIGTYLTYDGTCKSAPAAEIALTDTVSYQNLKVGSTYRVVGELHLVGAEGEDEGIMASAEQTFRADVSFGTVPITFEIDASELAGRSLVAFERLYEGERELARHEDLSDVGQTVSIVTIGTELTDEEGAHEGSSTDTVRLVDHVRYVGLVPGETYRVTGALMDQGTGEALKLDGAPMLASTTFVPESPDGTVEVTFEVDGALLAGRSVVAFETLSQEGRDIAIHADIEDEAQTVSFPRIGTTLVDRASDTHDVDAGPCELIDSVSYENLVPGTTYELVGTLMDREQGEPILVGEDTLCARTSFTPEEPSGVAEVTFSFDASSLAGHALVAYEELYVEERLVARHADLEDEGQTVRVPDLRTTLTDANRTELHEGPALDVVTLVDVVEYQGLVPEQEYELAGTLVDADTGKEIVLDGAPLTSTLVFVPTAPSGMAEVTFSFDATTLVGKTVVAFETLSRDGRTVVTHADLADAAQSYRFPAVATELTDGHESHELPATGSVRLVDKVSYAGLEPGRSYVVTGSLQLKESGEPVLVDGQPITSQVELVPEGRTGSVEVPFEFEAELVAGHAVVAFEELHADGQLVARHADLNNAAQTVNFATPPKTPPVTPPETPPATPPAPPSSTTSSVPPREETSKAPAPTPAPMPKTSDVVGPWTTLLVLATILLICGLVFRLKNNTKNGFGRKKK